MDQTLDQVIKTRKIKFNGRSMNQQQKGQGGQKQFVKKQFGGQKQFGGPKFVKQNFVQFRPRGQFIQRNFNQRRPQQFQRMNQNMMKFGGVQKRNMMGGQFVMGNRQNFQQRRPFRQQQFVMQRGFMQQRPQQFRQQRNMMQMVGQQQPRRMFQQRNNNFNGGQMRFQQQNRPMQQNMRQNQPTKLYISNLDFGVTNQDVKELFSEFGPMVRYGVNFSAGGRSVGSAEVFFKNKISAVKAFQKYNGVTLDGRPMKLEIAGGAPVMQQNQQVQRQKQSVMQRMPQQMKFVPNNKMTMKFVPNKKVAAKQIVAKAVLRNALKNFGARKQMGGRIMKNKMMMNKKKAAPNVEQLDADLEAYAASKD